MMTTMQPVTISRREAETVARFSPAVLAAGWDVSIQPNRDCYRAALRQTRHEGTTIEIVPVADDPLGAWTAYRIGRDVLLVMAHDGETVDLMGLIAHDDADEREELCAANPALRGLVEELYQQWAS